MLNILFSWLSIPRAIGIWIDSIAFSLIDNIYNLIIEFSKLTFFQEDTILNVMKSTYVVISIFALFRIALILVNAIISPDKLTDNKNGMGPVLRNLLLMFILLIFTPAIFNKAYSLQKTIVEGNYIQKIFLQTSAENQNPGKEMKEIVVTALIHPDERIAKYNSDTKQYDIVDNGCTGNCKDAIDEYNKMLKNNGNSMFSVFTKYIGVTKKIDDETVYVYSYMFFVTLVAGIFITYTLASFGLDIAIRAVELAVLEILSPLFIVTIIEPKSAQSGPFHNWLKTVGKTYVSLFIKLAILSFMILFISLINKIDTSNIGLTGKIVALLAVLIFAKKAPKWIGDMIGVEEDTAGIGGLGKKLGSAALVGGALTKAGHTAAGAAMGAAGLAHKNAQDRRAQRKKIREGNKLTHGKAGRETRQGYSGGYFSQRKQLHAARKAAYKEAKVKGGINKDRLGKWGAAAFTGALTGAKAGLNASDLKGVFKDSKGAISDKASYLGFQKPETKLGNFISDIPDKVEGAFGDPNALYERRKAIEDANKAKIHTGGKYGAGLDAGKVVEGMGDAVKLFDEYGATKNGEHMLAQYCKTNGMSVDDFNSIKGSIVANNDGNFTCKIDGKEVNLDKSLFVSGTGGVENLSKMFTTYQTNALANSSHTQEQYMQQSNAYQGMVGAFQNVVTNQAETSKQAQAIALALSSSLPDSFKVTLDTSSMSEIKKGYNDIMNNLSENTQMSDDERKAKLKQLSELNTLISNYDDNEKQLQTLKKSMDNTADNMTQLKSVIDNLAPIVAGIKGSTVTEKEQNLANQSQKYDKVLSGLKQPDKKE